MLTVAQAVDLVLAQAQPLPPAPCALADSLGLVLAEAVVSDADSPPFDKALMDGYALRAADLRAGSAALPVIEEVTAGQVPQRPVTAGTATRIMTGAPLPPGADAVVRIEDTRFDEASGTVHVESGDVPPGTNVLRRGTSLRRGETVLPAGRRLRPQELGALAELGRPVIPVRPRPRVAVLATGDELVAIHESPGPGQIRNSNETMLAAQIRRAGGEPLPLGIARDDRAHLRERISAGLDGDVLLLSGGVSAGKLDLVPSELASAGVRQVFHKVDVKPGKPIWFGVLDGDGEQGAPGCDAPRRRYVFGLPGNPVSSLVCFELFARPLIRRLMGIEPAAAPPIRARLSEMHVARGDRPTYHPARLAWTPDGPVVQPVRWHGSADLRGVVEANAMACFPAGDATWQTGTVVDAYTWDEG